MLKWVELDTGQLEEELTASRKSHKLLKLA